MLLLSILLGALAAITTSGDETLLPSPQSAGESIRVVSTSHLIDFPDEVVFRLEAEADSQITEVKLFYQLGNQKVRIYGYPSFTQSNRVDADFKIKTSGSSYIPSGADIEYYYVIRDAEGNTFETERVSLEYKDPRYDWQTFRQNDLVVLWHDRPESEVKEVARDVNERLGAVREVLGLDRTEPMKAVILNDSREASRSFPVVSEAASRGHLYGGFAFGELDVFVLVGLSQDGMVHEMTHLLIDEALSSPLAVIPAWLNEGLAMYFESGSGGREATVSRAASRGNLLPLRSMGTVPGIPSDVRLFYAQAWSLVDYMMASRGQESMTALLGAISRGRSIDAAILVTHGISLEGLEREWRVEAAGGSSVGAIADPGTIGTSFLIAGSFVVALVIVLFRWLRNASNPPSAEDSEL